MMDVIFYPPGRTKSPSRKFHGVTSCNLISNSVPGLIQLQQHQGHYRLVRNTFGSSAHLILLFKEYIAHPSPTFILSSGNRNHVRITAEGSLGPRFPWIHLFFGFRRKLNQEILSSRHTYENLRNLETRYDPCLSSQGALQ
jgi:hypothetical protein